MIDFINKHNPQNSVDVYNVRIVVTKHKYILLETVLLTIIRGKCEEVYCTSISE